METKSIKTLYDNQKNIYDYLVKFFGEEYSNHIREKLSNTIFFDFDNQKQTIKRIKSLKISKKQKEDLMAEYNYMLSYGVGSAKTQGYKTSFFHNGKLVSASFVPLQNKNADHVIFHETLHAISTSVDLKSELGPTASIGICKNFFDSGLRLNENVNEILTDYIALQIMRKCQKDNFRMYSNESALSEYSKSFVVFSPFYKLLSLEFDKSFLTNDMTPILKKMGATRINKFYEVIDKFSELAKDTNLTLDLLENLAKTYQEFIDMNIKLTADNLVFAIVKYNLPKELFDCKNQQEQKMVDLIWQCASLVKDYVHNKQQTTNQNKGNEMSA